jgi:peroxiredoxin-like protein
MEDFPHHYRVSASGLPEGEIAVDSDGLTVIHTAPPAAFGGPGDKWSPETLLVGAVADCFILTFRAIAGASKMPWVALDCAVEGTLDRIDGVTRFTAFEVRATLKVSADIDAARATRLLEKAEKNCLITNSMSAPTTLVASVENAE